MSKLSGIVTAFTAIGAVVGLAMMNQYAEQGRQDDVRGPTVDAIDGYLQNVKDVEELSGKSVTLETGAYGDVVFFHGAEVEGGELCATFSTAKFFDRDHPVTVQEKRRLEFRDKICVPDPT